MFTSLRTDFKEFVHTMGAETSSAVQQVKDEAIQSLEFLDMKASGEGDKLSEAEEEAIYRMGIQEVYTTPLKIGGDHTTNDQAEDDETKQEQPEDLDLEEYLSAFSVREKTSEITELLEKHETTLKPLFEELVPVHVTYADFWRRFFYRCDARRIEAAWALDNAKTREARLQKVAAVRDALGVPVRSLSSPFKAAVSTLTGVGGLMDAKSVELSETQTALVYTRKELEDLHQAINTSNQRITSLRTKLDESRQRLVETETYAAGLKAELEQTKEALDRKKVQNNQLESQIATMDIQVNTAHDGEQSLIVESLSEETPPEQPQPQQLTEESDRMLSTVQTAESDKEEQSEESERSVESAATPDNHPEQAVASDAFITPPKTKKLVSSSLEEGEDSPTGVTSVSKSLFKVAIGGLWGSAQDDDGSVSSGWGSEDGGSDLE